MEVSRRDTEEPTPNAKDKKSTATTRIFNEMMMIPKTPRRRRKILHRKRMKMTTLSPMGLLASRKVKQKSARSKASWAYLVANPNGRKAAKGRRANCLMWTMLTTFTLAQAKTKSKSRYSTPCCI
jgi:hypothetical protein